MNTTDNRWDPSYRTIIFVERFLRKHGNIANVSRHRDIVLEMDRRLQSDHLTMLCIDEYAMSLTLVLEALEEFGDLDIICIGGNWNGYTSEAKEYCKASNIGLYVTSELGGALLKDDFWDYYQKDEEGRPIDRTRG